MLKRSLIAAAKQGYQTVLSNGYYIDRMQSVEHHYTVDPIGDVTLTDTERSKILGGEATMWSELVTPQTIASTFTGFLHIELGTFIDINTSISETGDFNG